MYNWDYNLKNVNKKDPVYIKWKLERLINYGLNGEKIKKIELKKYWNQIKIDPDKRTFLKTILWPKKS
ncbi:hypothetical protein KKD20_00420 [Patescibacteria group bacterium]|nr:hypothetical protein [Patescibacteria group bacterium]